MLKSLCIALAAGGRRQCRQYEALNDLCELHRTMLIDRGALDTIHGPMRVVGSIIQAPEPTLRATTTPKPKPTIGADRAAVELSTGDAPAWLVVLIGPRSLADVQQLLAGAGGHVVLVAESG